MCSSGWKRKILLLYTLIGYQRVKYILVLQWSEDEDKENNYKNITRDSEQQMYVRGIMQNTSSSSSWLSIPQIFEDGMVCPL